MRDGVALGYDLVRQLAGGEIGALSVSRSRDRGPWDTPASLLLPHACGGPSSLGPLLGSPSIDDSGSAAGGGVCGVDDGTNVGVTNGPPFLVLMAADGAPSLLPVAIAASRHTWLETAAFASGGLVFAGSDSHIEVRAWSHAGDLSGPGPRDSARRRRDVASRD
jgi:hypothetical protein